MGQVDMGGWLHDILCITIIQHKVVVVGQQGLGSWMACMLPVPLCGYICLVCYRLTLLLLVMFWMKRR